MSGQGISFFFFWRNGIRIFYVHDGFNVLIKAVPLTFSDYKPNPMLKFNHYKIIAFSKMPLTSIIYNVKVETLPLDNTLKS